MKKTPIALAFALAFATSTAFAQTVSWSRTLYSPSNGATYLSDGHLVTRSMAADAAGNVIATGTSASPSGGTMGLTAKLNGTTGAVMWQQTFGGANGSKAVAVSAALDSSGNVYVVGSIPASPTNSDVQVVKYAAADGTVIWQKTFDAGNSDFGYTVAVDTGGNAIVGAESINNAGNNDVKVLKFAAASGALTWQQTIDGGKDDFITDVGVDGSGNVVMAGVSMNAAGNADIRVAKLAAADGTVAWNKTIDGGGADEAFGLAVDNAGNAYVTGYSTVSNAPTAIVAKLAAADGSVAWQKTIAGGAGQAIGADASGNVVVTAQVSGPGGHDYRTVKYSSSGAVVWDKTYDSTGDDYAYQLALDASGNAVVVGSTSVGGNFDWRAIQYAAADGAVTWQSHYNGTANKVDEGYGIAIANNAVFIGGTSTEQGYPVGLRIARMVPGSGVAPGGKKSYADFDGDHRADLIWAAKDGSVRIWLMNGTSVVDSAVVLGAGTGWSVIGTGDLDGDGKADIVWKGPGGAIGVWLMDGLTVRSASQIYDGSGGWTVTHVADLDGDGKADLVWKGPGGSVGVWLMNGTTIRTTAQILDPGSPWTVVATGDMNGDGKADLFLQGRTGATIVWSMNGTQVIDSYQIIDANTGWSVVAVGDLDGDGVSDILWTHTSGAAGLWMMSGKTVKSAAQILGGGTGWAPRKVMDIAGDGKGDIIWDHPDGSVGVWFMNGATMTSNATFVGAGNPWSVALTGK